MSLPPVSRRRPRAHDGSSTSERAVFAATEQLLTETALQDITVARILREAGISRANFYHYFGSKADVLAGLVSDVLTDTYRLAASPWDASPGKDRARSLDVSLRGTVEMWAERGAVTCAAIENMFVLPEVANAWLVMRERFVAAVAEQISYERASGRAPVGPTGETLAAVLVCGVERTFHVGVRGFDPLLASAADRYQAFTDLTFAAIYGVQRRSGLAGDDPTGPPATDKTIIPDPPAPAPAGNREADGTTARQILGALADLLEESSLDELSVERIVQRAGISRATFYAYFNSKDDAFAVLFQRNADRCIRRFSEVIAGPSHDRDSAREAVLEVVNGFESRAILSSAVQEWPRRPELRERMLATMAMLTRTLEHRIESERATEDGDLSPAGPLAAALMWTIERALAGSLAGEPLLSDLDHVTTVLGDLITIVIAAQRR